MTRVPRNKSRINDLQQFNHFVDILTARKMVFEILETYNLGRLAVLCISLQIYRSPKMWRLSF
jgi:hypothetical protein